MNGGSNGGSNRLIYDECDFNQHVSDSTWPIRFALDMTKYENCSKCVQDKFYHPYDMVDVESELRNQTRAASRCAGMKYNPACKTTPQCMSTFAPDAKIVLPGECCPIVYNNIKRRTDPGFVLPSNDICKF
jgi:hypothetical protein